MHPENSPQSTSINDFMRVTSSSSDERQIGNFVIVSDSLSERNGVGAYYQDLVDHLKDYGQHIGFLCPDDSKRSLKLPLPGDPTQKIWIPSYRRFSRMMRELNPECIIAATPGPYGLLGCWFARRRNIPFLVGFHTHYSGVTDQYENIFLRSFSRFYFNCADWAMFRYADLVLGNSEAMVELAKTLGAKRAEVMGTLLPVASIKKPISAPSGNLKHVIFAGRLAPEKRVDTVIEAAEAMPQIQFTLAGDGPLRAEVEAAASRLENLQLLGWISREELLSAMDAADLLVLPSVVESFGTVALEAMARARLVLVTPTCGIVEWPDLNTCLFQIRDNETLGDALHRIADLAPERRRSIASNAAVAARRLNDKSVRHWLGLLEAKEQTKDSGQ